MKLDWRNETDIITVQRRIQSYFNDDDDDDNHKVVWIVGSDILYNHDSHEWLARTIHQLSSCQPTTTTRIAIGFPERNDQNLDEELFLNCIKKYFEGNGVSNNIIGPSQPLMPLRRSKKSKSNNLRVIDFKVHQH